MYASFKSVTAKNGKILTPTRRGGFFVDLNGLGILRDEPSQHHFSFPSSWLTHTTSNVKCLTHYHAVIYIYIYSCLATSLPSLTRWHKLSPFSSRSCAAQIFLPSSQMFQANSKSVLRLGFRYISQKLSAHCFIILFPQAFISTSLLNLFLLTFSSVSITPAHLYPLKILLLPYQDTTLSYCHTPYALSQHLLLGVVHRSLSSSFSWPCPMI